MPALLKDYGTAFEPDGIEYRKGSGQVPPVGRVPVVHLLCHGCTAQAKTSTLDPPSEAFAPNNIFIGCSCWPWLSVVCALLIVVDSHGTYAWHAYAQVCGMYKYRQVARLH